MVLYVNDNNFYYYVTYRCAVFNGPQHNATTYSDQTGATADSSFCIDEVCPLVFGQISIMGLLSDFGCHGRDRDFFVRDIRKSAWAENLVTEDTSSHRCTYRSLLLVCKLCTVHLCPLKLLDDLMIDFKKWPWPLVFHFSLRLYFGDTSTYLSRIPSWDNK